MNNHDFSNAKVGDLVTSLMYGHGVIETIDLNSPYPIFVKFYKDNGGMYDYKGHDIHGFYDRLHFSPTLFKGHIDINSLSINYNTI